MTPVKFWMVWVHDTLTTEKRHTSITSAATEAARVAKQPANIGKKVYVLEATQYCFVDAIPVEWHPLPYVFEEAEDIL